MEGQNQRVSIFMAIMLIGVALCFDLVQLFFYAIAIIPFIGWVLGPILGILVTFIGMFIFAMWLTIISHDFTYMLQARRMARIGLVALSEFIPIVSTLPIFTVSIALAVHGIRKEDKQREKDADATRNLRLAQQEALEMELYATPRTMPRPANDNRIQDDPMYQEPIAA